jgi:hypothetical protein
MFCTQKLDNFERKGEKIIWQKIVGSCEQSGWFRISALQVLLSTIPIGLPPSVLRGLSEISCSRASYVEAAKYLINKNYSVLILVSNLIKLCVG